MLSCSLTYEVLAAGTVAVSSILGPPICRSVVFAYVQRSPSSVGLACIYCVGGGGGGAGVVTTKTKTTRNVMGQQIKSGLSQA